MRSYIKQSCGFLDIRSDAVRDLSGQSDVFPYYSIQLRNAIKCEIMFFIEHGVRSFCVCGNNDSDVTFFQLASEIEKELNDKPIEKCLYYSPVNASLSKQLAPYANSVNLMAREDAPYEMMGSQIEFLILIDDVMGKKLYPNVYKRFQDVGITVHRIRGLSLDFSIDYPINRSYSRELPFILKMKDFTQINDLIGYEHACRIDEIHSAQMNAILKSVSIEQKKEFIEAKQMQAQKLSEEMEAINYMQTHRNRGLESSYWKWKKSDLQNKETLNYDKFHTKYRKYRIHNVMNIIRKKLRYESPFEEYEDFYCKLIRLRLRDAAIKILRKQQKQEKERL